MSNNEQVDEAFHAALISTLPTSIEGVRLSAHLSAGAQTPTLRELDEALSIAWVAASRLAVEYMDPKLNECEGPQPPLPCAR